MITPYYDDGEGIQIYLGDCRTILPQLDVKVDLVLTDPPYGIKRDKGFEGFGGFGTPIPRRRYEDDDWDNSRVEWLAEIIKAAQNSIIFGGNFYTDLLPQSNHWIVWDKNNTMPTFGDCELAWTNFKRNSVKKYEIEYNGLIGKEAWRWHPTQKPLKLFNAILVDYSASAQTILDPFLGSGTTTVAARILGRKCIGIEIEEKYCKIAVERLRQSVMRFD